MLLRWVLYRVGCLSRVLGGVSRTYAHSRRQVRSFAPVLRGIGRRVARGGSRGWSEPQTGGCSNLTGGLSNLTGGLLNLAKGLLKPWGALASPSAGPHVGGLGTSPEGEHYCGSARQKGEKIISTLRQRGGLIK